MLYYNLVPSYTSTMQIALMKAKKKNVNIIGIIKVDFMAYELCWTALDCAGVSNKVATECICY